jgi:type I restriction enzyme, S subunit
MSLEAVQSYLRQAAVGSIMPNLNTKILQQMPVLLPSIEEQRLIASLLAGCETKITALEREMILLDELFRAILEELMTGRLSAVPLIENEANS